MRLLEVQTKISLAKMWVVIWLLSLGVLNYRK